MAELIALLLSLLTSLLGKSASEEQLAARMRQAVLDKKPAPMKDAQVELAGVTATGVETVDFALTGLVLDPLTIDKADLTISGVKLQPDGKLSLSGIEWTADIAQGPLTSALRSHVDKLSDATVKITTDGITLSGSYPMLLGMRVPYSVTGDLVVENQTQLMFRISASELTGVGMPSGLNKLLEKEINPVYDLAKFATRSKKDIERAKQQLNYSFMLKVEELTPQDGHIIASGSA